MSQLSSFLFLLDMCMPIIYVSIVALFRDLFILIICAHGLSKTGEILTQLVNDDCLKNVAQDPEMVFSFFSTHIQCTYIKTDGFTFNYVKE